MWEDRPIEVSTGQDIDARREAFVERLFGAGFSRFEVLPIEHDFWRFYRLRP